MRCSLRSGSGSEKKNKESREGLPPGFPLGFKQSCGAHIGQQGVKSGNQIIRADHIGNGGCRSNDAVSAGWARGTSCAGCTYGSIGTDQTLRSGRTGRTGRSDRSGCAGSTGCAGRSGSASRTRRADGALRTGRTLRACCTCETFGASCASRTGCSGSARRTLNTLRSL